MILCSRHVFEIILTHGIQSKDQCVSVIRWHLRASSCSGRSCLIVLEEKTHVAAWTGDLQELKALIKEGQDVNKRDENNRTPLICAAVRGHTDCVQWLLQSNANVDVQDRWGYTALHYASVGHYSIAQALITHHASLDLKDNINGKTALELASEYGRHSIVKLLRTAETASAARKGRNKLYDLKEGMFK